MVFHEGSERWESGNVPETFKVNETPEHESMILEDEQPPSRFRNKKKQGCGCYISASGRFRSAVDLTSLAAVIFCTFIVPFDMSFNPVKSTPLIGIDMGIEMFFITEICINFFTSYLDEDGEEITENIALAKNYIKTWFLIDAVSSIPSETATQITHALATSGDEDEDGSLATLYNLRAIRIIRLTKLLRLVKIGKIIEMMELSMPALSTFVGLFRLLFMMMVVAHINACIFYYIGSLNPGNSWMSKYLFGCCDTSVHLFTGQGYGVNGTDCFDPAEMPDIGTLYSNAIYWSFCTLATVGYGEVTPCNEMEQLYSSACMVVGSAMFAYIVGSISTVATTTNLQEQKMRDRMRELHEYLNIRKIPKDMSNKIRRQCMHRWRRTVFDEAHLLQDFTPKMRRQVVRHIHGDLVEQLPLFLSTTDEEFVTDLMVQLKPGSAQAGEEISKVREPADMYIILDGEVEVDRGNGYEKLILRRGDAINELETLQGVFMEPPDHDATCRYTSKALTFVDLFTLRRADLDEVMRMHPNTSAEFIQKRIETLQQVYGVDTTNSGGAQNGAAGENHAHAASAESGEGEPVVAYPAAPRSSNRRRTQAVGDRGRSATSTRLSAGLLKKLQDQLAQIKTTAGYNNLRLRKVTSGDGGNGVRRLSRSDEEDDARQRTSTSPPEASAGRVGAWVVPLDEDRTGRTGASMPGGLWEHGGARENGGGGREEVGWRGRSAQGLAEWGAGGNGEHRAELRGGGVWSMTKSEGVHRSNARKRAGDKGGVVGEDDNLVEALAPTVDPYRGAAGAASGEGESLEGHIAASHWV